ncbi:MAG: Pyridinium-3,5-bisthiocarboxylic acid mononucleotide nickel insertion protein [Acidimicrobiales bacterium]|nr:Pyridinium-3,5-bisthiocarboxylic acid mononucleotide nickel insertion protein [Acidimicrobiales bacterium]
MTVAWFHCFSGIAGDMALGALIDAGADIDGVIRMLDALPVGGWSLEAEPVLRGGIAGTKVHVHAADSTVVRTAAHIQGLVAEARLPERVQQRALAAFQALARAEGRLHGRPPDQVHFHEVGGIDAIVDVVGTCAALELLDVDRVCSSAVTTGIGMVRSAHGHIPNPAPAVVELLRGAPTQGLDIPVELTTPTGAALLAATVTTWGPMPAMRIEATGFGAGSREIDGRPNLTQVVIGQELDTQLEQGQPVVLLEANVDDATGEVLAHAIAALLEAGAHDAWLTPILMKKGRPAHTVSALADPALARQVTAVLIAETGSLGVRGQRLERWPSSRDVDRVVVDGLAVRVKVSPGRVKAEFDDAAKLARRSGRPLREVLSLVESTWRHDHGTANAATPDRGDADIGHLHDHHPADHAPDDPEPDPDAPA